MTPPFAVLSSAADALAAANVGNVTTPGWDAERHALGRFGYGAAFPGRRSGFDPDAWWSSQVEVGTAQSGYLGVPGLGAAYPTLSLSVSETADWLLRTTGNAFSYTAMRQLSAATAVLQAFSSAQLYESVVDFFANHLHVANLIPNSAWTAVTTDRDTIRSYAFGTFRDMLQASARDIGMQRFLALADSSAQKPNENYGRELLELQTVTTAAGYSQAEVVDSSRIMTGRFHDAHYNYQFFPFRHYVGPVQVLGYSSNNSSAQTGQQVGEDYLAYLASHPMTANNLARKLCIRFVSDTPSEKLIAAVAAAYLSNDTAILPTLSTIFRSTEFWGARGAKLRRPAENVTASVRALGLRPRSHLADTGAALTDMCTAVGQLPLCWPTADGYPDTAAAWRSAGAITSTWAVHRGLTDGQWHHAFATWSPVALFGGDTPTTAGAVVHRLSYQLLGGAVSNAQLDVLLRYLGQKRHERVHWAATSSRTLRGLVALLLHSPQHAQR